VLGGLLRATARPHASPRVIFATLPGERHELGLLCAALLAAAAGFGVIYLGPDLPAGDIAHAAEHTGARVVVLSATTPGAASRLAARSLGALKPGVEVWIGGREAAQLVKAAGPNARVLEGIESVVTMLADRA